MIEFLWRRWHRLRQRPVSERPPLRPVTLLESDRLVQEVVTTRPLLERVLMDNIVPFWYPASLDLEKGGYRINHDVTGCWKGPAPKHIIPQARTCWFFSRLAHDGYLAEALPAARHGFELLRDQMWDQEHGGMFWTLNGGGGEGGGEPPPGEKRLMGQVFALYALSEYAVASQDPEAQSLAGEVADIVERFHDDLYGGYWCSLPRAWEPLPDADDRVAFKRVDEHIHVCEALTSFHPVADQPGKVKERLTELILLLTSTAVRKTAGACSGNYRRDWTPLLDRANARVSYGHDVEATWLVTEASRVAKIPVALVIDWCRDLLDTTLRWGRDRRRGGVYFEGPLGGPADCRQKVWWVQAEALVGALNAFRLTGDERYGELYLQTLQWVQAHHLDWKTGDWHAIITPTGKVSGDKADVWKTPYHNGRAMMQCLHLLTPGASAATRSEVGVGA